MTHINGVIIAAHGRHYLAQTEAAKLQCVTRGKKSDVAVGDIVNLQMTSANQAVIESIAERKTLLYRSDQYKSKLLAANLTQLFIVVATEPSFSDDLISRALVAADAAGIAAMIILNKIDVKKEYGLKIFNKLPKLSYEVIVIAVPHKIFDKDFFPKIKKINKDQIYFFGKLNCKQRNCERAYSTRLYS